MLAPCASAAAASVTQHSLSLSKSVVTAQVKHGLLASTINAADELLGKSVSRVWMDLGGASGGPRPAVRPPHPAPPVRPTQSRSRLFTRAPSSSPQQPRAAETSAPTTGSDAGVSAAPGNLAVDSAGSPNVVTSASTAHLELPPVELTVSQSTQAASHGHAQQPQTSPSNPFLEPGPLEDGLHRGLRTTIAQNQKQSQPPRVTPLALTDAQYLMPGSDLVKPGTPGLGPSNRKRGRDGHSAAALRPQGPAAAALPLVRGSRSVLPAIGFEMAPHAAAAVATLAAPPFPQPPDDVGAEAVGCLERRAAAAGPGLHWPARGAAADTEGGGGLGAEREGVAAAGGGGRNGDGPGAPDAGALGKRKRTDGGRARRRSSVAMALPPGDLTAVLKRQLVSLASFQNRGGYGHSTPFQPRGVGPHAVDTEDGAAPVGEGRCECRLCSCCE